METEGNQDISQYLNVLRNAKSDNEKFAALLMVAKLTKQDTGDIEVKREVLNAVGGKFFSRLLKTKTVPDECPANIYKSVALSILSALCTDPQLANSPVLTENVTSFNHIVLLNPGDEDKEDQQLVDDTYDCFNSLCQTLPGLEAMIHARTLSTFCQAVVSQSYGFEKAHDMICCMVSCFGPETWDRCEAAYHQYVTFLGKQFLEDESLHKFEMCRTLIFLLTAAPNDKEETIEPPWIKPIVRGLDLILRSKIGSEQREPALKLASTMVQVCGIYSIQPPYTHDFKLFLLTTHLCCVEVRMVLEDPDLTQANNKGRLLSSCYTFLENIINHLTSGPPLDLDDRQVMQLHSAMVGAFGAVIHFLKRVAEDTDIQWNSILLATVRVLGAWLAEETSALREEIFDLIPFLVQVSKLCIPPAKKKNGLKSIEPNEISLDKNENIKETMNESNPDNLHNHMDKLSCSENGKDNDNASTSDAKVTDEKVTESKVTESEVTESDKHNHENKTSENGLVDSEGNTDKEKTENSTEQNCDKVNKLEKEPLMADNKVITESNDKVITESNDDSKNHVTENNSVDEKSETKEESDSQVVKNDSHNQETDILTEEELVDLHLKADILHYLLPGLCHLTAEEEPRRLLLESGALGVLDLYMWRQWEKLVDETRKTRETMSCLVILCNIFLNLIIVEPEAVPGNPEFAHILLLVAKGIDVVEYDGDYIVLWSHMVTLGLMLMRSLHKTTEECLEKESVSKFFNSSVRFLSGAYTAKHKKKGQAILDIVDTYKMAWEQISQTWFLSMQAFAACVSLYEDLPALILKTGWLPSLLKVISDVKANTVAEETKSCFQLLLTTVAKENKTARAIIKEKGGDSLSRFFKSRELTNTLNAS